MKQTRRPEDEEQLNKTPETLLQPTRRRRSLPTRSRRS